jgi:hypothetical protein
MNASPEHEPTIDGLSLAAAMSEHIRRHVVLSDSQLIACVLWVLHTWTFDAAVTTPICSS